MSKHKQQAVIDGASTDCLFQIHTYPSAESTAQAAQARKRKRIKGPVAQTQNTFLHQEAICPLEGKFKNGQDLDMHYTVSPAQQWADAQRYKSFRLNDTSYTSGEFVYVANPDTVENQRNLGVRVPTDEWVANILEIRAVNEQNVFARIAWMYWPQEVPAQTLYRGKFVQGRQPYHGKHELIASNHMDIIHAMSVTGHAKVEHWVENEQDSILDALYWRQGFDIRTMELSTVSLTCRCQTPPNPDNLLVGCTNTQCGQWLHKECLIDDILTSTWERKSLETTTAVVKEEESNNADIKMEHSATPEKFCDDVEERSSARSTPRRGACSNPVPAGSLGRAGLARARGKKAKPYIGKYEATLRADDGPPRFELKDLREGVPDAERSWTEGVRCLLCDHILE
jgi:hypothetical protein